MASKKSVKNYIFSEALWGIDDFLCSGNPIRMTAASRCERRDSFPGKREEHPASQKTQVTGRPSHSHNENKKSSRNAKEDALLALYKENKNCRRCPLGNARLNFVFGVGSPEARLVFVGEGPGYDEDHKGEPFVGRAGQLLNKIIAAMKMRREDVYIANITKCHPMIDPSNPHKRGNDRPPTNEEMSCCMPILEEQLKIISPDVISTLGATAAKGLLRTEEPIGVLRGKIFDFELSDGKKIKLVPTYHPAALLRNPALKKPCWEDIKKVIALLKNNSDV